MKTNLSGVLLLLWLSVSGLLAAPKPGDFLTQGPTKEKRMALTFDDGPGPNTPQFLDLLDRYNVKATFFLLGEQVRLRPEIAKMISEKGHELANHTMTHMNYNKRYRFNLTQVGDENKAREVTRQELVKDMIQAKDLIEKKSGQKIKILRMPYGIDRPWITAAAKEAGFVVVNWTYGTDWNSTTAEQEISGYVKAIKPGAVLLLHDGWPKSQKSLEITEAVIKAAKEKGFELVPLGELLGLTPK
ncbi:MAG: Bifunctional xylanase/deacetylase [Elusimicrobia bacterium]|nr:Bifunctional xylanase/deacetylase [Elusimicrobiota bacterium]